MSKQAGYFCQKDITFEVLSPQTIVTKVNKSIKAIFYFILLASLLKWENVKTGNTKFSKLVCSSGLFRLKNKIFDFLGLQTIWVFVNQSKKIRFLPFKPCISVKVSNVKSGYIYFSKLGHFKGVILVKKQHCRIFEPTNICNKHKRLNKNHFLSFALSISFKVTKFQNWARKLFTNVCAQTDKIWFKKQ